MRVAKWMVFVAVARGLRGTRWFRTWVFGLPAAGVVAHLFYRHMTRGWTESWGGWNDAETHVQRHARGGHRMGTPRSRARS